MRFGAFLPTYWDDYGTSSIRVAIAEAARAAEALGYEGVWANDIVVNPATAQRGTMAGGQVIEPLVTLASLVHLVPHLTLGTNVLVLPQRHPILVAKQAAALHVLAEGRLILGVGIGHRPEEFALLGADYARRAATTDEAIEVLRLLWREPVARYHGRIHHLDGVRLIPPPPRRRAADLGRRQQRGSGPASGPVRRRLVAHELQPGRLPVQRSHAAGADPGAAMPDDRPHILHPHRQAR